MNEEYKFNKEWLDLLLKNKDNENASFMLSDNDTRILLTYIEILQNRIDRAIEYIEKFSDPSIGVIKKILKESGE